MRGGPIMGFNSLIWLQDSTKQKIDPRVIIDLGLHTIYGCLLEMSGHSESILYELCLDQKTIHYRQDILKDFMNEPQLLDHLKSCVEGFLKLKKPREDANYYHYVMSIILIVEATETCLEGLVQALNLHNVQSEGLKNLKDEVVNTTASKAFKDMRRDLHEIRDVLNRIKSAEVSINMSSVTKKSLEAHVTEINDDYYSTTTVFNTVSETLAVNQDFVGIHMRNYIPLFNLGSAEWDFLEEMENAFKPHRAILDRFVKTYHRTEICPFITLIKELTFFQASLEVCNRLIKKGLPLCLPELLNGDERTMTLKGFYNINIVSSNNDIILNDLEMSREARIFILTGPNRGGKTTVTQAVGQVQVLAQLGLFIPAEQARVSLIDNVFTHFPVKEKDTIDLGRLGKECAMFSELFHKATEKSLLLLNESFSGTSHLESLKIAEEAVMAAKYKRLRMIFNTHLHELAMKTCHYNEVFWNDTNVASLVTGNEKDSLSYKIHIGEPLGKSYAKEVAKKYGVTYEQLTGKVG